MVEWSLVVSAGLPVAVVTVLLAWVAASVRADSDARAGEVDSAAGTETDGASSDDTGTDRDVGTDDGETNRDGVTAGGWTDDAGSADETDDGVSAAQRARDRAHERAQRRPPEEAAEVGETYELVVRETQYDREPPEVRGTVNGLQTFVRDVPDPDGDDALRIGDVTRVQVVDYGTQGTTAQARFLQRTERT